MPDVLREPFRLPCLLRACADGAHAACPARAGGYPVVYLCTCDCHAAAPAAAREEA